MYRDEIQPWFNGVGVTSQIARAQSMGSRTLFRYPGPCGLRDYFIGRLTLLGAPESRLVWLSDSPLHPEARSAAHFGTLAILRSAGLEAEPDGEPGVFVARNLPVPCSALFWVPPSALARPLPWDGVATDVEARALFGPEWDGERRATRESLDRHLEERLALEEAGAGDLPARWGDLPEAKRREVLLRFGIAPRWTR